MHRLSTIFSQLLQLIPRVCHVRITIEAVLDYSTVV